MLIEVGVFVRVNTMGSGACSWEMENGKLNPGIMPVKPIMKTETKTAAKGIQMNLFRSDRKIALFDCRTDLGIPPSQPSIYPLQFVCSGRRQYLLCWSKLMASEG